MLSALATLFAIHFLLAMSPGANTVVIARAAVFSGRLHALATIAGVCASGLIWVVSAAVALKAIFLASPWLYSAVTYAGAAYLIWMGWRLLRARGAPPLNLAGDGHRDSLATCFARGFFTNITNPKALVYFSSVFGSLLPPDIGPVGVAAAVATTWSANFLWYGGLSLVLSSAPVRRGYQRAGPVIDRVAGVVMVLFGIRLLVSRA